jgi:hypothetical protein
MKEAYGDQKGYKSACNLIYISKHITSIIDQFKVPIYTK